MHEDDILDWDDERIDQSRPPLRWIANLFGEISGWAILHIAYSDETNNFGMKYRIYSFIHKITFPLYQKYGTYYKINWGEEDSL